MDTMGERLRHARKNANFQSARSAALEHGWPPSTYAAHENGQNEIPVDVAEKYAKAFKVTAGWLLSGDGNPEARNIVKVEGLVGAGGAIETSAENLGHDGLEEIEVPFPLPADAAAFRVSGNSMFPRYDDGDIVIVIKRDRQPKDLLHFETLVITDDGNRYLKRIVPGAQKGFYDLESFNAPPMRNVKIRAAIEVHSVVRQGQWRALSPAGQGRLMQKRLRATS